MRINDAYRQTPTAADASAARPAGPESSKTPAGASPDAPPPVTVTVSDKARQLATQTGEASDAKVAALQTSIANGTFKMNPQVIANRIIDGE